MVGMAFLPLTWGLGCGAIAAEVNDRLQPSSEPLDLKAIKTGQTPPQVQTNTTISAVSLTLPSLWWTETQFIVQSPSSEQLLNRWLAYPIVNNQPGRIDMVVNRQLWSMMAYLERYEFLNELGETARSYGYNLRVFESRGEPLGAYTCDLSGIPLPPSPSAREQLRARTDVPCQVQLDLTHRDSVTNSLSF